MSPINLDDLPPDARRRVAAAMAEGDGPYPPARRPRPSRAEVKGPPAAYRCHSCGERFDGWPACERHLRSSGHSRGDLLLEPTG